MTSQTRRTEKIAATSSVDLERDPRSIIGTREFDAPRALVFSAWTDPKHLAQWWGPFGFTTTTHSFDFWRFVMHGPDGRDYQNRVTFEEIVPPQRIVYRHGGGDDVEPVQFRQTVIFEDLGGRTRITWRGEFPSAAERDRVIKEYGADKGLAETLAQLGDDGSSVIQKMTRLFRKHRIARLIEGAIEDFASIPQGYKPQSNRSA